MKSLIEYKHKKVYITKHPNIVICDYQFWCKLLVELIRFIYMILMTLYFL